MNIINILNLISLVFFVVAFVMLIAAFVRFRRILKNLDCYNDYFQALKDEFTGDRKKFLKEAFSWIDRCNGEYNRLSNKDMRFRQTVEHTEKICDRICADASRISDLKERSEDYLKSIVTDCSTICNTSKFMNKIKDDFSESDAGTHILHIEKTVKRLEDDYNKLFDRVHKLELDYDDVIHPDSVDTSTFYEEPFECNSGASSEIDSQSV